MNGTASEIRVVKPFQEAIELTKQILFRPFDLKKWLIIGFTAWLAHIGGGFNFNFNSNLRYDRRTGFHRGPLFHGWAETFHQMPSWMVVPVISLFILLILALCVLFAWLQARGRFMFTDCVVRNRAAIAEPWRDFCRLGNSFFLISLLVGLVFVLLSTVLVVPFILMIGRHHHHYHNPLLVCAILAWATMIFILGITWMLIAHLMIPIMYRRRILAGAAFREATTLISRYPDAITFYCLFWILLGIGGAITGCLAVCLTCCVAAIPYVGTVILLPLYVCLRAFGLFFLKQFGPDYDVWAGITPVAPTMPPQPPPPLPSG